MWGFSLEDAERRIAGFRQQSGGSLNVNYPLWDDPGALDGKGAAMRQRLQSLYDSKALGPLPAPAASASVVDEAQVAMLQRARPEVVSFHFALPKPEALRAIKAAGVFTIASATTVAEARMLEASGIDAVIAQGIEAGGHRATFTGVDIGMQAGLFALLPQMVDAVRVPVIAAGGIADGRTVAAAFMLGASAVQLGTAFLRCDEAATPETHRDALA
jgi:nitronate monooxygenase